MRRWPPTARLWRASVPQQRAVTPRSRLFGKLTGGDPERHDVQHFRVPCASSGDITVSLHNVGDQHRSSDPLLIWLPPFSASHASNLKSESWDGSSSPPVADIPSWLPRYPTAVINYRWSPLSEDAPELPPPENGESIAPLRWPTPIHDVLFGYSWILNNLAPPDGERRDVYVCGSYLGAGLAAGLALTESHARQPMAVRGLVAYNGIYDWTMFLPDHPVRQHRGAKKDKPSSSSSQTAGRVKLPSLASLRRSFAKAPPENQDPAFRLLKQRMPALFDTPGDLFDPFASACLFFHSAALHVPPDFTTSVTATAAASDMSQAIDALASLSLSSASSSSRWDEQGYGDGDGDGDDECPRSDAVLLAATKAPRKGYLIFPPRRSTLVVPETLLLSSSSLSSSLSSSCRNNNSNAPPPPPPSTTTGAAAAAAAAAAKAVAPASASASASASARPTKAKRATMRRKLAGDEQHQQQQKHHHHDPAEKNNFTVQAHELGWLMQRSVAMVELKERMQRETEFEDSDARVAEAERRVQCESVSGEAGAEGVAGEEEEEEEEEEESSSMSGGLDERGQELVAEWLYERMGM
ncbi:hypothetical protein B0T24DRAFT_662548 [Lasiosphaeria ovina]|uniref:Alpha/beta hydrolase fold-3 domain-containing protein n=1 Tax=Lasiosphaeria ovina TaxID=92902 RepID=A0AAE0NMM8_9PEZI|nr:hypothetical protein B0T24DRAFT_662548 [Lasiosphaeria ovina]